jgi:ABC-type branched-subunit amino acid transport system ATPase component
VSVGAPVVLAIDNLVVSFGGLTAVDVEHMQVRRGRIVGLVGANGAGKTTLLDAISGQVEVARGFIRLGGVDISRLAPAQRARRGLGRSYQNAALFAGLTVSEALAVALDRQVRHLSPASSVLGLPGSRRAERQVRVAVDNLIEQLGLGAFRDKFIGELSTGSRRIVDLAGILAFRPEVLLLDEPSSGVAQREVEALGQLLLRARDALGATLLIVEHDIPMLRALSDEMYALETGRVIARGTPDEVLSDPAVVASYLGTESRAVDRSGARRGPVVAGAAP